MGQRDREFERGEDPRRRRNRGASSFGSPYREQEWGGREEGMGRSRQSGSGTSRGYSGGYASRGESMRNDIEDRWQGREGETSARDYDYGYGRRGVSDRDYDREYGNREYYGGGGLYGGGIGGYTGGGYRGGGLGSNFDTSSSSTDYSDYPRSEEGYRGRGREGEGWWDRMTNEVSSWFGGDESGESYRGRGPRGYTRSDERIKEDINDRLTDYYRIDASDIEVEVNGREVVLSGNVNSRNEKRLAEDIAESVSGVSNVENRIRVNQSESWSTSGTTASNTIGTSTTSGTATSTERGRSATGT